MFLSSYISSLVSLEKKHKNPLPNKEAISNYAYIFFGAVRRFKQFRIMSYLNFSLDFIRNLTALYHALGFTHIAGYGISPGSSFNFLYRQRRSASDIGLKIVLNQLRFCLTIHNSTCNI
jgi:hypothetical protein